MRMIVLAHPVGDVRMSQCLLCLDGKYTSVAYLYDSSVSKCNFSPSIGYDMLLEGTNYALLELL